MDDSKSVFSILNKKADKFDLCSLFNALESSDVNLKKLLFVGSRKLSSAHKLCDKIKPAKDGIASAVVQLNLGLLTPSSPLPTYYFKGLDKGELKEEFIPFLQFFNHHIIKNILKFSLAEKLFIPNWQGMKLANLSMMGLDSVSSLHWLFSLYFPELQLNIQKSTRRTNFHSQEFCLGVSRLGDKHAFGGYVKRKTRTYSVNFCSDIAQTETRVFWPTEIRNRLQKYILPLIKKTHIYLVLNFSISQYKRPTYLDQQSFLGYTSLGDTTSNFTWLLYEG